MAIAQPDPQHYGGECDVIDSSSLTIITCAKRLAGSNAHQTAKNCFEFVRDEIKHSGDFELNPITCRASDVLQHETGYCYAKSHLLCALLRANGIPAGLCYQRLSINGEGPPFSLHGLNAIYLPEIGWYRVDARGNKPGVDAQFTPPNECLAFPIAVEGERDFDNIWPRPHPAVVDCLSRYNDWRELSKNLPDADKQI